VTVGRVAILDDQRREDMRARTADEGANMGRTSRAGAVLLAVLIAGLLAPPTAAAAVAFTHGVASGEVTPISAVLWTRVDQEAVMTVEVSDDPDFGARTLRRKAVAAQGNDFTAKVTALPLKPATKYFYRWRHSTSASEIGTFTTAPLPFAAADLRFAWSGDSDSSRNGEGKPVFNNWEALDAARLEQPDFFVYLGDTIYSDFRAGGRLPDAQSLDEYRDLYKAGRDFPALRELARATSIYAMWDDHEVRDNWDGETVDPTVLEIGRKAFLEYMPLTERHLPQDDDCATAPLFRVFRWGTTADIILLDTRSCRSASALQICRGDFAPTLPAQLRSQLGLQDPPAGCLAAISDPSRTVLGKLQKRQFKAALLASRARFKIVITPQNIQQFYVFPYDTWEGYGAERTEILNFIRDHAIGNVVFLTTDGHQNVMNNVFIDRFADPVPIAYEVMTGPIAAVTWQTEIAAAMGAAGVAAQQAIHTLLGVECRHLDAYSYGIVQIDVTPGTATIALKDSAGNVLHDQLTPARTCVKTLGP
jgi:phosphodiesterase/alkaline phosphatase D-like protein